MPDCGSTLQASDSFAFLGPKQGPSVRFLGHCSGAMAQARFDRLWRAWKTLRLSKSRQAKGLPWVRWNDDEDEDAIEPSGHTLTLNCPLVPCMFECLEQLTSVSIDRLSKAATCWHYGLLLIELCHIRNLGLLFVPAACKVEQFYADMEWEASASRLYKDSWRLRKLYSYALRREADAFKREQTPTDPRYK